MKKLILASFVFLGLAQSASAQMQVNIREEAKAFSVGTHNAYILSLPNTSKKEVNKAWQTFIKAYKGKTKAAKSGEIFTDDATVEKISPNTIDLYAQVSDVANGTEIAVWYNVGLDYLSSAKYPEQTAGGNILLQNFATVMEAQMLAAQVKEHEKALKTFEADLKKLEKEKTGQDKAISGFQNAIKKQEDNIRKAEAEITTNLEKQVTKKDEINKQKELIEETKKAAKKAGKK